MAKPEMYESDLYLVKDKFGAAHWFDKDPLRMEDRDEQELDIAEELFRTFGEGTVQNPLRVRLGCSLMHRCESFNVQRLSLIRTGELEKHVEDMNGHSVEILATRNSDDEFPLNGVVLDRNGETIATRHYTLTGTCSDKNEDHSLVLVDNKKTRKQEPAEAQAPHTRMKI